MLSRGRLDGRFLLHHMHQFCDLDLYKRFCHLGFQFKIVTLHWLHVRFVVFFLSRYKEKEGRHVRNERRRLECLQRNREFRVFHCRSVSQRTRLNHYNVVFLSILFHSNWKPIFSSNHILLTPSLFSRSTLRTWRPNQYSVQFIIQCFFSSAFFQFYNIVAWNKMPEIEFLSSGF